MHVKAESILVPPLRRALTVLALAVALAACSRDTSAQTHPAATQEGTRSAATPAAATPAAAVATAAAAEPSASEATVRALPDFTALVEKYGPAVVNVEVLEKTQPQPGFQGLSPNDPF